MGEEPLLRPEEVESVLAGKDENGADASEGPTPYSLREPVAIPPRLEDEAGRRLTQICTVVRDELRRMTGSDLELHMDALRQLRVDAALSAIPAPAWLVSLSHSRGGGLVVALPSAVALALVELALGGVGKVPESGRDPTPVESRLLDSWVAAAAGRLEEGLGPSLRPIGLAVGTVPARVAAPGETMAVGQLRLRLGGSDHTALLLVTAARLLPTSVPAPARTALGPLATRLESIPVEARPVLPAGRVCISDVMELDAGKVLKLDAPHDALLELRVCGQPRFSGRVVRAEDGPAGFRIEGVSGREAVEGDRDDD